MSDHPEEGSNSEPLSEVEIEQILNEIKPIYGILRANLLEEAGYLHQARSNPDITTGEVFTAYRQRLRDLEPDINELHAQEKVYPNEAKTIKQALEPQSPQRAVLLAYYKLNEDSPWEGDGTNAIFNTQYHKRDGYPQPGLVKDIHTRLTSEQKPN
jgi:hypothetical protein